MDFEIIGEITNIETIAYGTGVHARPYLNRIYGRGAWRKMKGVALIRLSNGAVLYAELHWYEAHGLGRHDIKRKRFLEK
jgi:hypothetical protein